MSKNKSGRKKGDNQRLRLTEGEREAERGRGRQTKKKKISAIFFSSYFLTSSHFLIKVFAKINSQNYE